MKPYPTTVLLATDGSADAKIAEQVAVDLCARSGATLHVVHAWLYMSIGPYPYASILPTEAFGIFQTQAEAILNASVARIAHAGGTVHEHHLRLGPAAAEIAALGEQIGADLIVLGSRGLGTIPRLMLGSTSEAVVQRAHRPVLLVRGGAESWPPAQIVIGDDGSATAAEVTTVGAGIGRLFGATLTIARAVPALPRLAWYEEGRREAIEKVHADMMARARDALVAEVRALAPADGPSPTVAFAAGEAAGVLLDIAAASATPTLLVIGTRGLGPLARLTLESVSLKILHAASESVLVVPHQSR